MPTVPLPDRPNLEQLKRQARDLQRAVRRGDPDALRHAAQHDARTIAEGDRDRYPLSAAQLVIARHYGFASWMRLRAFLGVVAEYSRDPDAVAGSDDPAREFLRLACLVYADDGPHRWDAARRILAEHPDLSRRSIHIAAVVADADQVRTFLAADPTLADRDGGPFAWTPLFSLAYARHDPAIDARAVLDTATALLDHGADPNAGYLWHGLPTPFTVLTGAFGEGEQGPARQPRHPHSLALARLLLDAGADPNDGQALYNRMFEPDDDHLELLFEYGLGTGDGGLWKVRLGAALATPAEMVQGQLEWAVVHDFDARVELILAQGGDPHARFADGGTATDAAVRNGNGALAGRFEALGVPRSAGDSVDAFVGAALAGDLAAIDRLRADDPGIVDAARAARPGLIVWATAQRRTDAIPLLVELGFDVNVLGRGDVPVEQPWETALHQAVANDDRALVDVLLALGADPNRPDARFDASPLGWARHFDHPDLAAVLEPLTR